MMEFDFQRWYNKIMLISSEDFNNEIKRIELERKQKCSLWLKRQTLLWDSYRKIKHEEDIWQRRLDR